MLEQIRMIHGINEMVCRKMDEKVARLAGRLGMDISKRMDVE